MVTVMVAKQADSTQGEEPRWQRAGPPYLLTREELVEELRQRRYAVTARQIQFWITSGVLPLPARGVVALGPDRRHRALFPASLIPVLEQLLHAAERGRTLAQLRELAPTLIEQWRGRVGDGRNVPTLAVIRGSGSVVAPTSTLSGSATAPAPTGSGSGLTSTAPVGIPRVPRALQRAAWQYAALLVAERGHVVGEVTLLVRTRTGEDIAIPVATEPDQETNLPKRVH